MPRWINEQGMTILKMDAVGMTMEQYLQEVDATLKVLLASKPPPNSVLLLSEGEPPSGPLEGIRDAWKTFQDGARGLIKAQTVVGLRGFKRVIARLVQNDLYFAASMEDAMRYLLKKSGTQS